MVMQVMTRECTVSTPNVEEHAIHFNMSKAKLFPIIRQKLNSLLQTCKTEKMKIEYDFPPLLNAQRAFLHNLCDINGIMHSSGPSLPIEFNRSNYRRGTTLKVMTVCVSSDKLNHMVKKTRYVREYEDCEFDELDEEIEDMMEQVDMDGFMNETAEEQESPRWRRSVVRVQEEFSIIEDIDDAPTPIEVVIDAMKELEAKKRKDRIEKAAAKAQAYAEQKREKNEKKKKRQEKKRRPSIVVTDQTTFVSGGVIECADALEIVEQVSKPSLQDRQIPKHEDFGLFLEESSVGEQVMNMMSKMGYIEGKGLGKSKQGIVNPITISHVHGKVWNVESDFDIIEPKNHGFKYVDTTKVYSSDEEEQSVEHSKKYQRKKNVKKEKKKKSRETSPVNENVPETNTLEQPVQMKSENNAFEGATHSTLLELVESKLEEMYQVTNELNKPVAYHLDVHLKREDEIRVRNLCRKWHVKCESVEDAQSVKKKREKRPTLRFVSIVGATCRPGEELEQIVPDSDDNASDEMLPENRVTFVKKNKNEIVDINGMSDAEFLRYIQHVLTDLVEDTDSEEKTVLVYNFPAMDNHRKAVLAAVCNRCSIGVDMLAERKVQTRSAKKQKLLKLAMGNPEKPLAVSKGLQGTVVQCMVTHGISIKPHRQLVLAINELIINENPHSKRERRKSFSKKQKSICIAVSKAVN